MVSNPHYLWSSFSILPISVLPFSSFFFFSDPLFLFSVFTSSMGFFFFPFIPSESLVSSPSLRTLDFPTFLLSAYDSLEARDFQSFSGGTRFVSLSTSSPSGVGVLFGTCLSLECLLFRCMWSAALVAPFYSFFGLPPSPTSTTPLSILSMTCSTLPLQDPPFGTLFLL